MMQTNFYVMFTAEFKQEVDRKTDHDLFRVINTKSFFLNRCVSICNVLLILT